MIRVMNNSDIMAVIKLELKVFNETLGDKFLDNELNINPFAKYYVYEINKEIIGYIGSRIYDDNMEIMNFVIKKEFQRNTYGTKLLNYVIETNKVKTITLEVRKSNKQAISFYNKMGFVLNSVRKKYYQNEDGYLLVKEVL